MAHGRSRITEKLLATLVAVAMLVASTALNAAEAEQAVVVEEEAAGPNLGNVSLTLGFDITTHYFFRGLPQENQGFIIQPYIDVGFAIYEGDGPLNSISINVGSWNSFHDEQTFASGVGSEPDSWYESDWYAGVSIGFFDVFTGSITYTALMSPNDGFPTIQEIGVGLAYDDSGLWGDSGFALNPAVLVVFETDNQADAGSHQGIYLQIGIEPSFTLIESIGLGLAIPVTVGLSIDDYYEDPTSGNDDFFGFVDVGLDFSLPLSFIPADFGAWTASAGVHYIHLGSNAAEIGTPAIIGSDDRDFVYGKFGLSLSY